MERIPDDELHTLLADHKVYVESRGLRGTKLELSERDLSGIDFTPYTLCEAVLVSCDLSHTNLTGVDLYASLLYASQFHHANLTNALLVKSHISDTNFSHAIMRGANMLRVQECYDVDLTGADLEGANLFKTFWIRASFQSAILRGCELERATFMDTSLLDTDLRGAKNADKVHPESATVRIRGEIQRLEGDALRDWLLAAVEQPL